MSNSNIPQSLLYACALTLVNFERSRVGGPILNTLASLEIHQQNAYIGMAEAALSVLTKHAHRADSMVGTNGGFTMIAFNGDEVPVGSYVFTYTDK